MRKPWSISTTVRNPERVRGFLKVLKELENQPFDTENQVKYQILLIKNKLYTPTDLTANQRAFFDDVEREMPFEIAERIFKAQDYEDPAMRGRNSVAPLNKMGLCIAKNAAGVVKITDFGEYFLNEDFDLGKVFFIHFLKWQLPNPDSRDFQAEDGFAIKPFVGTLHLIQEVNIKWTALGNRASGITKEEFCLFAPTLIDYRNISRQAETLIDFRTRLSNCKTEQAANAFRKQYRHRFIGTFLGTADRDSITSVVNNLRDYGDNAIRYFRLTRYLYIRGGGFYVDLEPRRSIEIEKLLQSDTAAPSSFRDVDEYRLFIADIHQPELPWETDFELKRIIQSIMDDLKQVQQSLQTQGISMSPFAYEKYDSYDKQELLDYAEKLRQYRRRLQDSQMSRESQRIQAVRSYIEQLRNIFQADAKRSVELERLATLALNALNDALIIKPNYPVGDDNEPTFTAPGNKADVECFYEKFNAVCEVTLLTDRSQWYYEGQPVMRHLRDFEEANPGKITFCLFVAPKLHQDTIETFWMAVRYGYKGQRQRIVPLSLNQFVQLLENLVGIRQTGKTLDHESLLALYNSILAITDRVENSSEWIREIPDVINSWKTPTFPKKGSHAS